MIMGWLQIFASGDIIQATSTIFLVLISLALLSSSLRKTSWKLPPGPRGWPVVGNLLQLGSFPPSALADLNAKYGPLVYLRLGHVHAVTTNCPTIIKELTTAQDDAFCSRPSTIASEYLGYNGYDVALAPMGGHWKMMRRICLEHLLTTKRLDSFQKYRIQEAQAMVHAIWEESRAAKVCNLRDHLSALGMNVMTHMLLGKKYFGAQSVGAVESSEFRNLIHDQFWLLGVFNVGDYLPYLRWLDIHGYDRRMKEVGRRMDQFHASIIEEHRQRKQHDKDGPRDFVDVLLSLPGEKGEKSLTDIEMKALIQDLIAGATDTSSVTSEWAMLELLRNPQIMQKARDEIGKVVGSQRPVEERDLNQLPYLKAIVKETFRRHPPGAFIVPHKSLKHTKVAGYDIPKGTVVFINVHALGKNPAIWDRIDEFLPERFLNGERIEFRDADYKLVPFGAGKRQCPGASLGQFMVMLGLARLIHSFDWFLPPHMSTVDDIDMQEVFGLTTHPATPLQAVASPRLLESLYSCSSSC
ncbi:hypothetical protein O6H91_15G050700 [Diphasiastrum complanatum]|uniref:Uncharacterized protein n=1 Tax=Diphasiastrum complanatum TaxID=34168 RepID=A0ACC2BI64_DIPCM|nr:hypothetical protein O6H91_15G050700 [Diphasiastrum complanatum]